jgi:hypothetical protein
MTVMAMQGSGTVLETATAGGKPMATINQPKPSEPKSPQADPPPLQPGGPESSRTNAPDPKRPNHQTPDTQRDKFGNR